MNLTPEIIQNAIDYISKAPDLLRLWQRRKVLLMKCEGLRGNKDFERVYGIKNDELVPKIQGDCRYCMEGLKTHMAQCLRVNK